MSKRSKTISVRIYYHDAVFNAINFYVMKHTERLPGLTDAIAMYEESKSNSANNDDEKPVVGFYPRKFSSFLFYPLVFPFYSLYPLHQAPIPPMKSTTMAGLCMFPAAQKTTKIAPVAGPAI
jgi:hypothetical protein